jgi:hypothetical protein
MPDFPSYPDIGITRRNEEPGNLPPVARPPEETVAHPGALAEAMTLNRSFLRENLQDMCLR